ncbi:MAG TPA: hypothetical protein VFE62_11205 [Gemmataceae bacterium]|nr:hypothetical protein [Gemmataceae bacterium]
MSEGQPNPYRLEDGKGVKEQVRVIMGIAEAAGKLDRFLDAMKKARHELRNSPSAWGDPEYTVMSVRAVVYHGIARPLSFRFAVFEQHHAVVILDVRMIADFD